MTVLIVNRRQALSRAFYWLARIASTPRLAVAGLATVMMKNGVDAKMQRRLGLD